jgi:hypothetical protein
LAQLGLRERYANAMAIGYGADLYEAARVREYTL